eukprot:PhM_4_TR3042/c0_g1_i1/m.45460
MCTLRITLLLPFTVLLIVMCGTHATHAINISGQATLVSSFDAATDHRVTHTYPMQHIVTPNTAVVIGTDNGSCAAKDPSGRNVQPHPTRGYVQFPFTAPETGYYVLDGMFYVPDSLSNAFYIQRDEAPQVRVWDADVESTESLMQLRVSTDLDDDGPRDCFRFDKGNHTVRLFVREPGAGVSQLNVTLLPSLRLLRQSTCTAEFPCVWDIPNVITFEVGNLCSSRQLTADMFYVIINETETLPLCDSLMFVSNSEVQCMTPPLDYVKYGEVSSLRVYAQDKLSARADDIIVPLDLVFNSPTVKKKANTTLLPIIVAVSVVVALLVAVLMYVAAKARHLNRYAPRKPPMCLLFTDVENSTSLWQTYADSMPTALKMHHAIIRK